MDYDSYDIDGASATQPTQTLPQTQEVGNNTQSSEKDEPLVWGRLDPLREKLKAIDLVNDVYTIGRNANCDIKLSKPTISNQHANIKVVREGSSVDMDAVYGVIVFLSDTSTNGTYLNNERVGKGNKKLLKDGDIISLPLRSLAAPKAQEPGEKLIGKPVVNAFLFRNLARGSADEGQHKDTGEYTITNKILGTGNFAEVRLAVHATTGLKVAAKCMDKKRLSLQAMNSATIKKEAEILHALHHPCVIKIEEMFETEKYLYIMLELVSGGALFEYVHERGRLSEKQSMDFTYQMLKGLDYLHKNGVTHRDMKPENVLLLPYQVEGTFLLKITDFGLAKIVGETSFMQTLCGTPNYLAPEIMDAGKHSKTRGGYTNRVDCWSLGVIVYIMLAGHMPFSDDITGPSMGEQISEGLYSFPDDLFGHTSEEAITLITNLLCVMPSERYSVEMALNSPWFKSDVIAKVDELLTLWQKANPPKRRSVADSDRITEADDGPMDTSDLSNAENGELKDTPVHTESRSRKRPIPAKRPLETATSDCSALPVKVAKLGL
ncbi:CAMK/RAD53 protein kinase [Sphaeroforma arctica JP610]|uniref:CAMK/RAD53 protein kinase n=1 Tax=Sphaeroforma arctica JP610 TaxID=667725 RepID=A0A0L0FS60_9EUKA|nr:CAMK/RAD53 protein kinase [Sphaeroforma arctica JP610]KNC78818.1 CAMK/RAD53 protein kinase [Sphaeroforma arctica JP610]|eukprot:XP_014152720.1 CAMK/RAD53 protein kinase [Sphaeroforma arctica JP610]